MTSLIMKPFSDLAEITNSLFQSVQDEQAAVTWSPPVDVYEDENQLTIVADLPGVDSKSIEMRIQGDMLWFRCERKPSYDEKAQLFCAERASGPFLRTIVLPAYVNTEAVKAHCENGVLTITLPKKAEAKPRQIAIEG